MRKTSHTASANIDHGAHVTAHRGAWTMGRLGIGVLSALLAAADGTCIFEFDDDSDPPACLRIAVECDDGAEPIDSDGDGCALECPSDDIVCPAIAVVCQDGAEPIDSDGDGCALECPAPGTCELICPDVYGDCPDGQQVVQRECACGWDCVACPEPAAPMCPEGQVATVMDRSDGYECPTAVCIDDIVCPAIAVTCEDGAEPIDADGDGCALECPTDDIVCPAIAVMCENDAEPIDSDGDGCALECPAA